MSAAGRSRGPRIAEAVIWHDAEYGGYAADLRLWERLAGEHPAACVDLGAGTGRVALHLAAAGTSVTAVDDDPALLAALGRASGGPRARGRDGRAATSASSTWATPTR